MARSMTAYGRAHCKTSVGLFLIEIHSVNRKSLDIHTNLPKEFIVLDMGMRNDLAALVKRGYVTVRMTKETEERDSCEIPAIDSIKKLHANWERCAKELGYDPKQAVPFSMIMQFSLESTPSIGVPDENLKKEFFKGFDEAMKAFMEMKKREGVALIADIFPRLDEIEKEVEQVKKLAKLAPKRYHDRLEKKLHDLKFYHEVDEERLAREVVLFADKIDVTEEVIRLASHIRQFEDMLKGDKVRIGRELDFLTQEMNREVNTIAAKSQELAITQTILRIKGELEKIREQLANIE